MAAMALAVTILFPGPQSALAGPAAPDVATAPDAAADSGAPRVLTLAAAVEQALEKNPEIGAAEQGWLAARERPRQAGSLADPTFSYEAYNIPESKGFAFGSAIENMYSVSQAIPFPGKLGLRRKSAGFAADAEGARADGKRLEIVAGVKRAYADLYQAQQNLAIARDQKRLAIQLADTARVKYEVGERPQVDLLRADVEVSLVEKDIQTLEEARRAVMAQLNALLDAPQDSPVATVTALPVEPLPADVAVLESSAQEINPSVRAAGFEIERARSEHKLARWGYLPDFEITARRFVNLDRENGYGAMFMVTIPWVWVSRHQGEIAEAAARRKQTELMLRAEQNMAASGVRGYHAGVERGYRNAELLRTVLLPQSRLAYESALASYRAGEGDFLDVLESQKTLFFLETQLVDETAAYHRGIAGLEEMAGRPVL